MHPPTFALSALLLRSPLPMPAKRILQAMFVEAGGPDAARLPPTLEARAVDRLSWMILALAGLFFATIPLRWGISFADGHPTLSLMSTAVSAGFGALSLFSLVGVRLAPIPRSLKLQLGLLYEVLTCFALALVEQILVGFVPMPLRLSVVAVVLLTFPLVVPSPPRWRVVTTILAALTLPLAIFWVQILTRRVDLVHVALASAPTLVVAAIAGWMSQVVHRLRMDVGTALAFGQYELVEKLGEGGMGEVWRARHARLVRPAAIKLIRPDTAGLHGESARQRFHREAQATGALRSPHTVSLYDYGRTEDGTLYYAMEMLEGVDCETVVGRFGPMPAERVVHILEQVARSLAEAHERGLIHRDIKPANVFLCRIGRDVDFVKVLDFGLVKPQHIAADSPVSAAGAVSGTPGYVAPEHLAGKPLDGRADLYSLGCVAYFLLTAKRVFSARSRMELMTAHLTRDPEAPSVRVPGLFVPEPVERLVLRLLARDVRARIASADELLEEIEAVKASLTPWDAKTMRKWWTANLPEKMTPPDKLVL